jgi:tetratricopeptide (TPR) repeat protein
MTHNPSARRVHRADAGGDDAFVAGVLETTAWAQQNRQRLIIGGVVAIIAVLAIVLIGSNRASKRENAARGLVSIRNVAASGNNQLAIADMEKFMRSYGGTPAAAEVRLLLARAYLQEGQAQKAIDTVRDQASRVGDVMGVNAAFLLAAAHEAAQQSQQAEDVYLRVADGAEFLYQKQEALDNAARLRIARGDAPGAVQLYDRLFSITPQTHASRQVYELRAGEARALAGATSPVAPTTGN